MITTPKNLLLLKVIAIIALVICFSVGCTVTTQIKKHNYNTELAHTPKEIVKEIHKTKHREMISRLENKEEKSTVNTDPTKSIFDSIVRDDQGRLVASIDAKEVSVVARTRVLAERDGKVTIDFVIVMPKDIQSNSSSVVITPRLHRSDSIYGLEPLQVRGGLFGLLQARNYWRYTAFRDQLFNKRDGNLNAADSAELKRVFEEYIDFPYIDKTRFDSIASKQETIKYYYQQDVPVINQERKLLITLEAQVNTLDGGGFLLPSKDTISFNLSTMLYFVDNETRYVKQVVEKYAVVNDRNYLSFNLGKDEIVDTLGDNKAQLGKIVTMMDQMMVQEEYYIDTITLSAAASPEGAHRLNERLSKRRAQALELYLKDHYNSKSLDTLLKVKSIGENWGELTKLIVDDSLLHNKDKKKILDIIEKNDNLDEREAKIKNGFPEQYKYLKKNVYPKLRTVDFRYNLRKIGMVKDTIHTTTVDTSYMNALQSLKRRDYETAKHVLLKYDDMNAVVVALSLGYNQTAYDKISKINPQDGRGLYMRAICASRVGELKEGLKYFKKACEISEAWEFRGRLDPEISLILYNEHGK